MALLGQREHQALAQLEFGKLAMVTENGLPLARSVNTLSHQMVLVGQVE